MRAAIYFFIPEITVKFPIVVNRFLKKSYVEFSSLENKAKKVYKTISAISN